MGPFEMFSPEANELFSSASRLLHLWKLLMPQGGLSNAQFHMIMVVHKLINHDKSPATISQLAQELHISKSAASQTATTLIEMGYLERDAQTADRRVAYLCLTAKGEENILIAFRDMTSKINWAVAQVDTAPAIAALNQLADILGTPKKESSTNQQGDTSIC